MKLENRRRKLLDAYEAGALPIELLRERQDEVTAELADAHYRAGAVDAEWSIIERNLQVAFRLAYRCADSYAAAGPANRRMLNQDFFTALHLDTDPDWAPRVARAVLAQPFQELLDPGLPARLGLETKNHDRHCTGRGSKETEMVEVMGLEPTTSTLRT
jgi:site-specific DNA recombinase